MSVVVFGPDSVADVDFADRMRHPAAADPAGGMWLSDTEPSLVDADALRKGRLNRLRGWMSEAGYGAVVLFDPYNQRYATGSRNMFGYFLRNSTRYFFIPTEGPIILFEYPQSYHVSMGLDTIDETAGAFADEIADLMKAYGGGSMKIGLDRCQHLHAVALAKRGCDVKDCQGEILAVRAVKTAEEIKCLQVSMAGAEAAVAAVREAIKPGVSENDLFAIMSDREDFYNSCHGTGKTRTGLTFNTSLHFLRGRKTPSCFGRANSSVLSGISARTTGIRCALNC